MKVIFTQNVKGAGQKDEVKEINEGYARNFLIPRKFAVEATSKALGELRKKLETKNVKQEKEDKNFQEAVGKLGLFELIIKKKANETGHLFSAVTLKEIVQKLHEKGIFLSEKDFDLKSPIKVVGKSDVPLMKDKTKALVVVVESE